MPRVTHAYRDAMRERLLHAAATAIIRFGYDGTTVRHILAEAKVAPSTLYSYFKGKDDIVQALADRAVAASTEALAAMDDEDAEWAFRWLLRSTMSHPFPASEILAELRSASARGRGSVAARRINATVVEACRPFLERLRRRNRLRVSDEAAFAELLDIIHDGMARRQSSNTFATSFERVGAVCLEVLNEGTVPTLQPR